MDRLVKQHVFDLLTGFIIGGLVSLIILFVHSFKKKVCCVEEGCPKCKGNQPKPGWLWGKWIGIMKFLVVAKTGKDDGSKKKPSAKSKAKKKTHKKKAKENRANQTKANEEKKLSQPSHGLKPSSSQQGDKDRKSLKIKEEPERKQPHRKAKDEKKRK